MKFSATKMKFNGTLQKWLKCKTLKTINLICGDPVHTGDAIFFHQWSLCTRPTGKVLMRFTKSFCSKVCKSLLCVYECIAALVFGSCATHQLHELSCAQVDLPALGSAHHTPLIGHVLQGALLLLCNTNTHGKDKVCTTAQHTTNNSSVVMFVLRKKKSQSGLPTEFGLLNLIL